MDFFGLLSMIGGLALFLYGMDTMGQGLEKLSGGRLERILEKLTSNPIKAVLLGAGVTAVIQSSSATTVMVVGFVNSGIMKLTQAVGIIMGANIGTTVTSWLLSLTGIESGNFFVQLLKPSSFSPVLALIGMIFIMFTKNEKKKNLGTIMIGFAILMFGMETMSDAVKPLADVSEFTGLLTMFSNPILGMIAGAVLTAIIQSSSASVGILQALCATGAVSFGSAIPIIMGQNIGTCVTALLSSIGVNRNAKRVAVIHISFNIIGTVVCLILFYGGNMIFHFGFMDAPTGAVGIAFCHTVFNVLTTVLLLPFSRQLEQLARRLVRTENKTEQFAFLDPLLMRTPGVAISECVSMANRMGVLAHETMLLALEQLPAYSEERETQILTNEDKLDTYEDRLGSYLVEISQHGVSMSDIQTVSRLLHAIGDFERIGDHALNLQESAQELHEKELQFSDSAKEELHVLLEALRDIMDDAFHCFVEDDVQAALVVEPLEETIDQIIEEIRMRHIRRLQTGECTIQLGFILNDLLTNIERVSDHCSNIAVSIVEEKDGSLERHSYLHDVKEGGSFSADVKRDLKKYRLPQA